MIDDKTAQMAVNTINEYCHKKQCMDCALVDACFHIDKHFRDLRIYFSSGTFEDLQKSTGKPPKFDIRQKDSADFQNYINEIFLREAEKYGLPMSTGNSIKWSANGEIKVTFVDDDNKTNYMGRAKCHPGDAFNPEIGIKLAIERAAQDMRKPFIPYGGQAYYYVDTDGSVYRTCFFESFGTIESQLKVAMGNCFKTRGQAVANADIILKRLKKATELLKTLRDEGEK